jgi:hypothetical protein
MNILKERAHVNDSKNKRTPLVLLHKRTLQNENLEQYAWGRMHHVHACMQADTDI